MVGFTATYIRALTCLVVLGFLAACAAQSNRMPLSAGDTGLAYGIPGSGNQSGRALVLADGPAIAFSGGGQKGAYGAGVMVGWTERGNRPEFALVTGVSTGAILALFTFLGPGHDATLETLYTRYQTRDLVRRNVLGGLLGGNAVENAAPYRAQIDSYVPDDIVAEIATEARRGRKLLIGSTDLDAKAPYLWDITAIANSGHPNRGQLIRDIIQASSAIPAIFPPVVIPITDEAGQMRDQLHVDGGVTRPFVFRPILQQRATRHSQSYLVLNEFVAPQFKPVTPNLRGVAGAALATMITFSTRTELLLFADEAAQTGLPWRGTSVPVSFTATPKQEFDPVYMKQLFDLGRGIAAGGDVWALNVKSVREWR